MFPLRLDSSIQFFYYNFTTVNFYTFLGGETVFPSTEPLLGFLTEDFGKFFEGKTAREGKLSEPDLLFPRQEMQGDAHDEGAEYPGDEPDDRIHARGAVDDLFAFREAGAHFIDLFLVVRT